MGFPGLGLLGGGLAKRAEGPAVRPAQGNALGARRAASVAAGPTGQPFVLRWREGLAHWAGRRPTHNEESWFASFPKALPWAGRTGAPSGQLRRTHGMGQICRPTVSRRIAKFLASEVKSPLLSALLALLLLLGGCTAYHIGNQSLYPEGIRTVYVPMIRSSSFRRNLGEWLTEAVAKEIERKTPYKVVNDPMADSTLTARIVGETKTGLVPGMTGDLRDIQVALKVDVSWIDRQGCLLRQHAAVPLPEELVNVTGTGDVIPEVGRSIATGQQEAIQRLAEQIVGSWKSRGESAMRRRDFSFFILHLPAHRCAAGSQPRM